MRRPPLLPWPPTLHHGGHQQESARAWIPPCPGSRTLLEELFPLFSRLTGTSLPSPSPDHAPPWAGGGLTAAWLLLTAAQSLWSRKNQARSEPCRAGGQQEEGEPKPRGHQQGWGQKGGASSGESPAVTQERGMSPPKLAQGRQSPTEECWWDKIQPLEALESPSTAVPSSHTLPTPGRHPGGSSQLQQIFGTGRCVPNCGAGQGGAGEPLGCPSPCHRGSRGCQGWFLRSSGLLGRPKAGVFIPYSHCCCILLAFQVPGSSFTPHSCCPLPAQEGPRVSPLVSLLRAPQSSQKKGNK